MKTQNTKTAKKVTKSMTKLVNSYNSLLEKENKTSLDFARLANAEQRIEDKTASKVYKVVTSSKYLNDILGGADVPTFKQFIEKLPQKLTYSNYDGFMCLRKFNTSETLAKKVARQNKATAKK